MPTESNPIKRRGRSMGRRRLRQLCRDTHTEREKERVKTLFSGLGKGTPLLNGLP